MTRTYSAGQTDPVRHRTGFDHSILGEKEYMRRPSLHRRKLNKPPMENTVYGPRSASLSSHSSRRSRTKADPPTPSHSPKIALFPNFFVRRVRWVRWFLDSSPDFHSNHPMKF